MAYAGIMSEVTAASAAAPLADDLGWGLGVLFRAYLKTLDTLLGDLPGGVRGWQVLSAAATTEASGQGALAARLGIDRTVMTYLVDDLERAGLVQRHPDPADRRHKRVVATELGRRTVVAHRKRLAEAEEHLLTPLPAADRGRFRQLLAALAQHADRHDPVRDTCQIVTEVAAGHESPPAPRRRR